MSHFILIKCVMLIISLLFVFNNCGDNVLGPTVEIDLQQEVFYNAIEPNYPLACIEIKIPITINKEDIKAEIIDLLKQNDFEAQLNASIDALEGQLQVYGIASPIEADEPFNSESIVVQEGGCPKDKQDPLGTGCTKKIPGIPFTNYYRLYTYVEELNPFPGFIDLHPLLQNNVCPYL